MVGDVTRGCRARSLVLLLLAWGCESQADGPRPVATPEEAIQTRQTDETGHSDLIPSLQSDVGSPAPTDLRRDSAGLTIVESSVPSWQRAWTVAPEPFLRVGKEERAGHDLFRVLSALRFADGTLVVANRGSGELRWYSGTGEYLGAAGRSGSGPGEFRDMSAVFAAGDSVFVYDFMSARVTVFDRERALVRTEMVPGSPGGALPQARMIDGTYLMITGGAVESLSASGPPGLRRTKIGIFRYTPSTGVREELGSCPGLHVIVVENGVDLVGAPKYAQLPLLGLTWTGRAVADSAKWVCGDPIHYHINMHHVDAGIVSARKVVDLERITDRDWSASLDGYQGALRQQLLGVLQAGGTVLPTTAPAFETLRIDSFGNTWVKDFPRPGGSTSEWSVFDATGVWLGVVQVPPGLRILSIGADHVVGLTEDEFGVEVVSVHSLEKF